MIAPGSSVLLYTDGLVERRGEVLDEGLERLARAAAGVRDLAPDELVSTVVDAALADGALGDAAQPDDIAVVAVRLLPGPLHDVLPAQPRQLRVMRRAVERWAAAVGLSDEVLDDLQYALGEAAANAVEHAYGEHRRRRVPLHPRPPPRAGRRRRRPGARLRPLAARAHRLRAPRARRAGAARRREGRPHRLASDGGTTVTFRVPVPPAAAPRRPRAAPGHTRPAARRRSPPSPTREPPCCG